MQLESARSTRPGRSILWPLVVVCASSLAALAPGEVVHAPRQRTVSEARQEPASGVPAVRARQAAEALESILALEENFREATRLYAAKVLPMREGKKRELAQRRYFPRPEEWAGRFLDACQSVPGGEAEARAWAWIVEHAGATPHGPIAAAGLIRTHLASPLLLCLCEPGSVATDAQLERVWEASPHGDVRASAALLLADRLLGESSPAAAPALQGEQGASAPKPESPAERRARGLALLTALETDLGGVRLSDRPVAEIAADRLYTWRVLQPGMPAPEFSGSDLDGASLKYPSDVASKACVVVFWRTREMGKEPGYGAMRTLHTRFSPLGVRFVGINGDRATARAARAAKLQRMPMPSLADGPRQGAAAHLYRVQTWPSAVLLDSQGQIVQREVPLGELAELIDAQLAAAKADSESE